MTLHQLIAYWSETTLDNISGQSEMELKPFLVKEAKYIYLIVWGCIPPGCSNTKLGIFSF